MTPLKTGKREKRRGIRINLDQLALIRCFLLDMDGTVFLGDKLLPGALEFVELLKSRGIDFFFITNNSSRHRRRYAEKLYQLGLHVKQDQIFTSGEATAIYLIEKKVDCKIHLVGTPALEEEFETYGFRLVEDNPDFVVLGFDTTLTYNKLWRLCDLVREGVPYIATHPDYNCPTENGFMPDIGATIAYVEASTGRRPDVIIGKPYRPIIDALCKKSGLSETKLCMVGDRLYTDIALGQIGLTTVLVLTGEAHIEDLRDSPYQPDFIMQDLAELSIKLAGLSPMGSQNTI
jgi:4-nitrophenyl phosphatase/NagD protein